MANTLVESVSDAIVRASWQGACLAILVAAICLALHRVPAKWRSGLWLLVLARFLLPVAPESPISLFNLPAALPIFTAGQGERHGVGHRAATADRAAAPLVAALSANDPPTALPEMPRPETTSNIPRHAARFTWNLIAAVWLTGLAAMVAYRLVLAVRVRRLLSACRGVQSGPALVTLNACRRDLGVTRAIALLVTDRKMTPAVAGLLRPKIIVPTRVLTLDSRELAWLFRHELAHIRRLDTAIQNLWWWARAVHWFNPLIWWAASRAQLEMELACDESVLERAGPSQRIRYGQTLLKVAELTIESAPVPASVAFLLRKRVLARRVDTIVNFRCRPRIWAVAALFVLLVLAGTGLTDAVRRSPAAAQAGQQAEQDKAAPPTTSAPKAAAAAKPTFESDEAEKPKRTMKIQVLGPDGKPVAKAAIQVAVWTKEPFKHNTYYRTDTDGRTTIALPQSIDILRIWARSGNLVPLFAHWWPEMIPTRAEIPAEFTFRMQQGTTIGGVVRDEQGKPIKNVGVQVALTQGVGVQEIENPVPDEWLAEGIAARRTDADGRWRLDNVPKGADVRLMLTHRDYTSDYQWAAMQKEQGVTMEALRDQTAVIVMQRGIPITGTVTDVDGKPLADALVVWGDDPYLQPGRQEVRTDRQGMFRFQPLPAGPITLTVVAEGWAPEMKKVEVTSANPPVDFQLSRGLTMRFEFVDRNGQPIPNVYVGITEWRGKKSLYNHKHPEVLDSKIPRQADKNGVYEWTWAPRDQVHYWFESDGSPPTDRQFYADDQTHVITLPER
jgi:beta-lactamase regulating signal transducer with metallopeptidase domain